MHRQALEEKLGRAIRPGLCALHHCDTPPCYEPEHLYEGTMADNMRDKMRRGRGRGQFVGFLSPEQRTEVCRRYAAGGISQRALGVEYGVSGFVIGYAVASASKAAQEARC